MIVRAYKHILQAIISAVDDVTDLASSITSCLNVLLGTPDTSDLENLTWNWVESFLSKRYACEEKSDYRGTLRKFSIL